MRKKVLSVLVATLSCICVTPFLTPHHHSKPSVKLRQLHRLHLSSESPQEDVFNSSVAASKFTFPTLSSFKLNVSFSNIIVGALLGFTLGITLPIFPPTDPLLPPPSASLSEPTVLFSRILSDLESEYVDPIDPMKLFKTGVKSMLSSLDPYTEFEDLEEAQNMQESVQGRYGGVGLVIGKGGTKDTSKMDWHIFRGQNGRSGDKAGREIDKDNTNSKNAGVYVIDAFERYAYDEGLRRGDRLVRIGGVEVSDSMGVEGVRDLLRGEPGTSVVVGYERDMGGLQGKVYKEATLQREVVKMSDVRLATLLGDEKEGIGYIQLSGFNAGAARDFRTALTLLRASSPHDLKALVLDLRANPGGLLSAAVEVAGALVDVSDQQASQNGISPDTPLVTQRDRTGVEVRYPSPSPTPLLPAHTPLILLVSPNTASAAEIVAGAVQDLDAGVVLGAVDSRGKDVKPAKASEREEVVSDVGQGGGGTYGKGLVQKILPLPYNTALKFTSGRYYTPSGRCLQKITYTGGREDGKESKGTKNGETLTAPTPQTFYTLRLHRPVRSGVGVEPDLPLVPPPLSPAEAYLLSTPTLSLFASDYLSQHAGVRPEIGQGVKAEKAQREGDGRFRYYGEGVGEQGWSIWGKEGGGVGGYFVLDHDVRAEKYRREHGVGVGVGQEVVRDVKDARGPVYGMNGQAGGLTIINEVPSDDVHKGIFRTLPPTPTATSTPTSAIPTTPPIYFEREAGEEVIGAEEKGEQGGVVERFFWGRQVSKADKERVYAEFMLWIEKKLSRDELDFSSSVVIKDAQDLLSALDQDHYPKSLREGWAKFPEIWKAGFLEDLQEHKDRVMEDVMMSVLAYELPDRLLNYRGILTDPQVREAVSLARGDRVRVYKEGGGGKGLPDYVTYEDILQPPKAGARIGVDGS